MSALVALLSGLLWGAADFIGGTVSRRIAAVAAVAGAQATGLVLLAVITVATGSFAPSGSVLILGTLAGLCSFGGLTLMYSALANGKMGVVAPIIASSAVVPLLWGLAQGDQLSPMQYGGIAACLAGIILVTLQTAPAADSLAPVLQDGSAPANEPAAALPQATSRTPIIVAVLAALVFGGSLIFLAAGSEHSPTTTTLVMRAVAAVVAVVATLATRSGGGLTGRIVMILVILGTLDAGAYLAFGWASATGQLASVSVLSALYPVETAVLAYFIHRERLSRLQITGVAICLAGVVALAL